MPPRTVKRGAAAAGSRRTARTTRGTPKAQNQTPEAVSEESMKFEEVSVLVVEEVKIEQKPVFEEKRAVMEFEADAKELGSVKSKSFSLGLSNLVWDR